MLQVHQSFDFPAVYLDHWAVRRFASNAAEGERFVHALKACGGVLVLSHTTFVEITGAADPRHADEIAAFFESVLPNVYFAMFDVEQAMKQEIEGHKPGLRMMAPPDVNLLVTVAQQRPDDFQPFTLKNIVRIIAEQRGTLGTTWRESNQALADHVNMVRQNAQTIAEARSFTAHPVGVPTKAVMQELMRPLFLDPTLNFDANDGGDVHHATLSIVYCDFVLLDGKWEDLHARMRRRFNDLGLTIRTAAVYSARRKGVDKFLEAIAVAISPRNLDGHIQDSRQ